MADNSITVKEDSKVGRPCKYDPKMLDIIRDAVSKGVVYREIAAGLNIAESTLYEWKKNIPEVTEAFKQGEEWLVNDVKNSLYKSAKGYDYEEITRENGVIKKVVTKHMPGNVVAQQVVLYNKRPDEFKAKNHDSDQNITVKLEIPQLEAELQQIAEQKKALEMQLNQGVWEIADE